MKLHRVESGHTVGAKLKLTMVGLMGRQRPVDVLRVMLYRPELFGAPFAGYVQHVLRGESEFSVGERELMAAIVSQANRCRFCLASHRAVAERALGVGVVDAALTDPEVAPIRTELRAAIRFLVKLTKIPEDIVPADIQALRDAGVSSAGIRNIIHICGVFSAINRIADALAFEVPSATAMGRMAGALLRHGYEFT